MKKLFFLISAFVIFAAFSRPIFAFNDFDYEMSYSPKTNSVIFKIHHTSLFSNKNNYKITTNLNGLNSTFKESASSKYTTITLGNIKKNSQNNITINILNDKNQALSVISESLFVNNFNNNELYHFFNPNYDMDKKQFTFSVYIKKSNVGKYPVRVLVNDKLVNNLSFLSQNDVSGTSFVLQKYALPLSSSQQVLEIYHTSDKSSKVLIKKLTITPGNSTKFPDVDTDFWAYNTINWSKNMGYTVGGYQNKFYPFQSITRGEAVTILSRLMNMDADNKTKHSFTDIKEHWAEHNIANLGALKIVSGYSDGTFKPNNPITRGETAALISNYLIYNQYPYIYRQGSKIFSDVNSPEWFERSVVSLNSMAIVSGYIDKTFKPNNEITRAEFISIIKNFNDDLYKNVLE